MSFLFLPQLRRAVESLVGHHPRLVGLWHRSRGVSRGGRARPGLELLEDRLTPSTYAVTEGSSTQIPLTGSMPGDKVTLKVNFTLPDSNDPSEGEGRPNLTISGVAGSFPYGQSSATLTVSQANQVLTATMTNAPSGDGDEGAATVQVLQVGATIHINGGKVLVYAPDASPAYTSDQITATVTNTGTMTATFLVAVNPPYGNTSGTGDVSINGQGDVAQVTIGAGKSQNVTITGVADSKSANDVQIGVLYQGNSLGMGSTDNMTVVDVTLGDQGDIYNQDTPQQMLDDEDYRITVGNPGANPNTIDVTVDPTLPANEPINIIPTPLNDSHAGSFTVTGGQNITSSTQVQLVGGAQTTPGDDSQLTLSVQAAGRNTLKSNGFNVAAIPLTIVQTLNRVVGQDHFPGFAALQSAAGFWVDLSAISDSGATAAHGNPGDLSDVQISENITENKQGIFTRAPAIHPSGYQSMQAFTTNVDRNDFTTSYINAKPHTGSDVVTQYFTFHDSRTGATTVDIPVPNSGFQFTYTVYQNLLLQLAFSRHFDITTNKVGAALSANGTSINAGTVQGFSAAGFPQFYVLPNNVPLVVRASNIAHAVAAVPVTAPSTADSAAYWAALMTPDMTVTGLSVANPASRRKPLFS